MGELTIKKMGAFHVRLEADGLRIMNYRAADWRYAHIEPQKRRAHRYLLLPLGDNGETDAHSQTPSDSRHSHRLVLQAHTHDQVNDH